MAENSALVLEIHIAECQPSAVWKQTDPKKHPEPLETEQTPGVETHRGGRTVGAGTSHTTGTFGETTLSEKGHKNLDVEVTRVASSSASWD